MRRVLYHRQRVLRGAAQCCWPSGNVLTAQHKRALSMCGERRGVTAVAREEGGGQPWLRRTVRQRTRRRGRRRSGVGLARFLSVAEGGRRKHTSQSRAGTERGNSMR